MHELERTEPLQEFFCRFGEGVVMVEQLNVTTTPRHPERAQPLGLCCGFFQVVWQGFCLFILLVSALAVMARAIEPGWSAPEVTNVTPRLQGQSDVHDLVVGVPIERELAGGETHSYRVTLAAGQYLRVIVDQRGIDVVVRLFGPDGQQVTEVNRPNGAQGPEPVSVVAEDSSNYRLEVSSPGKEAAPGHYEVRIEEMRPATPQDRSRVAAERAFAEGEQLRRQRTAESLPTALEKYEEALPLWQAVGDPGEEALTLNNAGLVCRWLGEIPKALEYYRRALPLWRTVGDRREEATTLHNIAAGHHSMGELQQALEYYIEALQLSRAVGDRSGEVTTLNNIGVVYSLLGEYQKALEHYSHALSLSRAAGYRRGEIQSLGSIGWVYHSLGEPQQALEYYAQALSLSRALGDRHQEAQTLKGIGTVYYYLGEKRKALEYYDQALWLFRAEGDRQSEASTLNNIGRVYASLGEHQKALEYYNQALLLSRAVEDRSNEASILDGIARVERDQGRLSEARTHMEAALDIIESLRTHVAGQELRASFLASKQSYYKFYMNLLMRLHEREPSKGHDAVAIQTNERARARSLLDLLAEANIDVQQGIDPALKQRERATHARLSWIQSQLIQTHSQASPDKNKIAQLEEQLKQVETEREQLEVEITQKHPRYAELQYPTPLGLKAIQDLLDEQTALLEYALGEDRSFLFVVTKTDYFVAQLPPASSISDRLKQLRDTLITKPQRKTFSTYIEQARALHQTLIEPARKLVAGKQQLIIVPDGLLHYLPFEVLLSSGDEKSLTAVGPRQWPYLVRDYAISVVPSSSVLASLRRSRQATPEQQKAFLAYADPVYGATESSELDPVRPAARSAFSEASPWKLEQLPYSREEVNRIAALYPQDKVRVFLQQDAREEDVKVEDQLSQCRFVHFAAHGLLNENKPQYSGIVLSLPQEGVSRPKTQDATPKNQTGTDSHQPSAIPYQPSEDGLLQVYEIFNLKLNADWGCSR